jgi:hypothetical protein
MISIFNIYSNQFNISDNDYQFTQKKRIHFFQTSPSQVIDEHDVYNNRDGYLEIDNVIALYKGQEPLVFNPYFMMFYIFVNKTTCAFTKGNYDNLLMISIDVMMKNLILLNGLHLDTLIWDSVVIKLCEWI